MTKPVCYIKLTERSVNQSKYYNVAVKMRWWHRWKWKNVVLDYREDFLTIDDAIDDARKYVQIRIHGYGWRDRRKTAATL